MNICKIIYTKLYKRILVFKLHTTNSSPDCNENPAMERRNEVEPRNEELQ